MTKYRIIEQKDGDFSIQQFQNGVWFFVCKIYQTQEEAEKALMEITFVKRIVKEIEV